MILELDKKKLISKWSEIYVIYLDCFPLYKLKFFVKKLLYLNIFYSLFR